MYMYVLFACAYECKCVCMIHVHHLCNVYFGMHVCLHICMYVCMYLCVFVYISSDVFCIYICKI
jgi:hypothetical protein